MERTVPKVWGEEHWIVNRDYCGKKLILKKGFRCSMHRHPIKDETFHLDTGSVFLELGEKEHILSPGDSVHIPTGSWHRFTGLEESVILEFSTHHEDDDCERRTESGPVPPEELAGMRQRAGLD